jgi:hypothetical protein
MSRLLSFPLTLPVRFKAPLGRRAKVLAAALVAALGIAAGFVVFRTAGSAGTSQETHSKATAAPAVGLRAARARAIADLHAHNANRTARPVQVTLKRTRTADVAYSAALFATHSWYVAPPPPPPPPPAPAASLAPPAPTAPPLPFQYIGSYKPDGEAQVFFLTHDDRVYDAKVGDTLENTYSIDGFNGSQLLLTYKPLNIQQQLMVGGTQ